MTYKSPIDVVYGYIKTTFDEGVMRAVQSVQINVNKEELIKALHYDRSQYEQGYEQGYADGLKNAVPVRHAYWIDCRWAVKCSACNYGMYWSVRNYCPKCGAKMDLEEPKI